MCIATASGRGEASSAERTETMTPQVSNKMAMYENVTYHKQRGTLLLTPMRLVFKSTNLENTNGILWPWMSIEKIQVNKRKVMIKLWSSKFMDKSITFGLDNLDRLEELRLDVKSRLTKTSQVSAGKAGGAIVDKGQKEDEATTTTTTQEETESQSMGSATTPDNTKTANEPCAGNALDDAMLWLYESDEFDVNDLFRFL